MAEARQVLWALSKVLLVVNHLADQKRWKCAYTGQTKAIVEVAYEADIKYYQSLEDFAGTNVTKRQLHGKDGLYEKIYGYAAAMKSQLHEVGKDIALSQLNLKSLAIPVSSLANITILELNNSRQEI